MAKKQSNKKNSAQKRGIWVAFEGNDGAGKSYQMGRFAGFLKNMGHQVVETREPGGNDFSEELRKLIFNNEVADDPRTQLLLFTAARRRNILKTVLPALESGKVVLSDRSEGSSFAYQCYQLGIPFELVLFVNNFATESIRPDLTVFLSVSEKIGLQRVQQAKGKNQTHFDKATIESWRKREAGYKKLLAIFKDWVVVDANKTMDEVFEQILYVVARRGLI